MSEGRKNEGEEGMRRKEWKGEAMTNGERAITCV